MIADVVRTRVSLSFAYEYSRIAEHAEPAAGHAGRPTLPQFHADFLAGRTVPLLGAIAQQRAGVGLESYLNQSTLTTSAAWGFSLGIGKWLKVSGQDFRRVKKVSRFNADGAEQRSYLGLRGYTGKWVGETFEWTVDLRADMKVYASPVTINDYTFGLHLAWTADRRTRSPTGNCSSGWTWRCCGRSRPTRAPPTSGGARAGRRRAGAALAAPHRAERRRARGAAAPGQLTPESYAGAMAAAMPWMDGHPARQDARQRRALYTPLWEQALSGIERRGDDDVVAKLRREG